MQCLFSSLLSVRVFSALFPPLGPFGDQFQLISGALGPRKHSNFIRKSSNSSFPPFSRPTPPGGTNTIQKRFKCWPQSPQKVPQRSPGALGTVPGEPQEPPQATPRALLGDPLASQKPPGVVLEASSLHFGASGASFTSFCILFRASLLASLLS